MKFLRTNRLLSAAYLFFIAALQIVRCGGNKNQLKSTTLEGKNQNSNFSKEIEKSNENSQQYNLLNSQKENENSESPYSNLDYPSVGDEVKLNDFSSWLLSQDPNAFSLQRAKEDMLGECCSICKKLFFDTETLVFIKKENSNSNIENPSKAWYQLIHVICFLRSLQLCDPAPELPSELLTFFKKATSILAPQDLLTLMHETGFKRNDFINLALAAVSQSKINENEFYEAYRSINRNIPLKRNIKHLFSNNFDLCGCIFYAKDISLFIDLIDPKVLDPSAEYNFSIIASKEKYRSFRMNVGNPHIFQLKIAKEIILQEFYVQGVFYPIQRFFKILMQSFELQPKVDFFLCRNIVIDCLDIIFNFESKQQNVKKAYVDGLKPYVAQLFSEILKNYPYFRCNRYIQREFQPNQVMDFICHEKFSSLFFTKEVYFGKCRSFFPILYKQLSDESKKKLLQKIVESFQTPNEIFAYFSKIIGLNEIQFLEMLSAQIENTETDVTKNFIKEVQKNGKSSGFFSFFGKKRMWRKIYEFFDL